MEEVDIWDLSPSLSTLLLDSARLPGLFLLSFPEVLGLQVCATMPNFLVGSWGFEQIFMPA